MYRSKVGMLQYLTITRPNIAYSVNKVCQYMQKPLDTHWKAVKRLLYFLKCTLDHGLVQKSTFDLKLKGFSYVEWASFIEDRKSTADFYIFLDLNLISWAARKQHKASPSSTKVELVVQRNCVGLALYILRWTWLLFLPYIVVRT